MELSSDKQRSTHYMYWTPTDNQNWLYYEYEVVKYHMLLELGSTQCNKSMFEYQVHAIPFKKIVTLGGCHLNNHTERAISLFWKLYTF
jgi:hypothetical protein